MASTFDKLNLKDQAEILVINAPDSFTPELATLSGVTIRRAPQQVKAVGFALAFVTRQEEVDALAKTIAGKASGDAIVWFAYPKGSSKKYRSQINRDSGWAALGQAGFEPVRMVAIDEDWSAVRFRRVEFIKTMKRGAEHAMSAAGKRKAAR